MRKELKKIENQRKTFTGVFERLGTKSGWNGNIQTTILLTDIRDEQNKIITDHLWFNFTQGFGALSLQPKDKIQFVARVKQYTKGYQGRRDDIFDSPVCIDYKLSYPTQMQIIAQQEDAQKNLRFLSRLPF